LVRRSQNAIVYSAYHGGQVVVRGGWAGRVGLFDTAMLDAAADCLAACTHNASAGDNAYTKSHARSTGYKNMDENSYTIIDSNGSSTDILAYSHVDGSAQVYRYPDCIASNTDLDQFAHSDEDTGRAGHAASDGAKRAGNKRIDPDHNGDS
jgi:hypothetical protein